MLQKALHQVKAQSFHPAVADWFAGEFRRADRRRRPRPGRRSRRAAMRCVAAPTGSGKTLAAFLAAIDSLVEQGLAGELKDETQVVYVSPLKALSNDIERNLEAPIAGIRAALAARGLPDVAIRTWVRTGDTPSGERDRMRRRPPHIVVTTPESLYVLLGSESGRAMLATTRTVIVDEIHALAAEQARHPSRAVARAAGGACAGRHCSGSGSRQRRSRSRRWRASSSGSEPTREPHHHRQGLSARPRARHRGAGLAARGGDVGGGLAAGLRPARPRWSRRTGRRSSSSTPAAWPSASPASSPTGCRPAR